MRLPLRHLATALVLLAACLFPACGGSSEVEMSLDEERGEATAATPEESRPQTTTAPAQAFASLESYRIDLRFTLEGTGAEGPTLVAVDLDGAFVAPDRSNTQVTARLDELELEEESITIAHRSWVKVGDSWVEDETQIEFGELSPGSLLEELSAEQLRLIKPSKETVNGVESLRYNIGRGDIEALRSIGALFGQDEELGDLPEDFDIGLWLAEDGGWPVRITMTAQATVDGEDVNLDFSVDVTDVNDPNIRIEPPES